jgi:hypothetical protein
MGSVLLNLSTYPNFIKIENNNTHFTCMFATIFQVYERAISSESYKKQSLSNKYQINVMG